MIKHSKRGLVEPNETERERCKVRPFVEDGDIHVAIMHMT